MPNLIPGMFPSSYPDDDPRHFSGNNKPANDDPLPDMDSFPIDTRPHSRACGVTTHPHGSACSDNCPTCHGKPNLDDYEHITKERYDELIEERYRNLHTKLMSASSSKSGPSIAYLGTELELLEQVRDHLFPEPTPHSFAENEAVRQLQNKKFGHMSAWELDKNHQAVPQSRRGSDSYGRCEVCNQMSRKLDGSREVWVHDHKSNPNR